MDNALYLHCLKPTDQPGLNVRRIKGFKHTPSDEQMLTYYANLIQTLGGQTTGVWESGICLANPSGQHQEVTINSKRNFTSIPSQVIQPGYPLGSIQIDPLSQKYISEMTDQEQALF